MALTQLQKMGWGLADLGIVVFVVVKQLLILAFLTQQMGIPIALAGTMTTLVLLFDIVTDPLVGVLSDRWQSKWGRRAPWLILGALVMGVGMLALFAAPQGMPQATTLFWVVGFFLVATLGFTMCAIPYGAMAGEMTQDPAERSVMTAWRMGFASIGILLGGALLPGLATKLGYFWACVCILPAMIGAIWLSVYLTRHVPRSQNLVVHHPIQSLRMVLHNRAFVVLAVVYGLMTFAIALIVAGLPFAASYLVTDPGDTLLSAIADATGVLSLLFACFVLGSLLSQACWVWASRCLGKLAALFLGLGLYLGVLLAIFLVLPNVTLMVMAGLFVVAGGANGAYQQIPWAMFPDLMDVTRADTGLAIEGAFSALWLFGQKVANAFAPLVLSLILGYFGWQETIQGVVDQPQPALVALHWSMSLIPAIVLAAAMFLLALIYAPLERKALRSLQALQASAK